MITGRLPKWFGERPGKKANDPETPEEEELKKNEEDELEPFGLDEEEAEEEVRRIIYFDGRNTGDRVLTVFPFLCINWFFESRLWVLHIRC